MTHCSRCGLVSEDDRSCSWCGTTFVTQDVPVVSDPEPVAKKREFGPLAIGGLIVVLIAGILVYRQISDPGAESVTAASTSQATVGNSHSRRPAPSKMPRPKLLTRAASPNLSINVETAEATAVSEPQTPRATPASADSGSTGTGLQPTGATTGNATSTAVPAQGAAHLVDARLSMGQDDDGQEIAGGRVVILNDGPYEITDFRVTMQVDGASYELVPFSGSPDNPTPVTTRSIKPGTRVEIPVMTMSPYRNPNGATTYRVVLRASMSGPPGTVTDSMTVPGSGPQRF